MPISPISGAAGGIAPIEFPKIDTAGKAERSAGFTDKLTGAIESLQKTQAKSDELAVKAATGNLNEIHDYMIAANQTEIATQLTVAVRNKAVDAFNQIMNMQV